VFACFNALTTQVVAAVAVTVPLEIVQFAPLTNS
jgi:hypothetical protein